MSLAAAWALGMVLIGRGCIQSSTAASSQASQGQATSTSPVDSTPAPADHVDLSKVKSIGPSVALTGLKGLADLQIEDRLQKLIDGGPRPTNKVDLLLCLIL